MVAVDAVAGLVVPAGAADDELAAVGEVGEVGAEHVPGVLHAGVRAARRVVLDAGRGARHPAADEAADEAVTGTAGNARDPQGIGLAVVTRLEIGVDSAAGLVTGGAPGRDAAAQVEDARPAVAGLRGEFGRRAVLHVLGALDAVEVEHPPVGGDRLRVPDRLAGEPTVGALEAPRGVDAALLEGRGPAAGLVGAAAARGRLRRRGAGGDRGSQDDQDSGGGSKAEPPPGTGASLDHSRPSSTEQKALWM